MLKLCLDKGSKDVCSEVPMSNRVSWFPLLACSYYFKRLVKRYRGLGFGVLGFRACLGFRVCSLVLRMLNQGRRGAKVAQDQGSRSGMSRLAAI